MTCRHFYSVVEPANIATGLSPPVLIVIWYFARCCLADIWLILQRGVLNQPSQRPTCRHAIPCLPLLHFNPIMIRPFDDDAITIQTVHKEPNIPNILWAHKCHLCHASKQPPILARPSPLCPKGATTPAFPVQSTFTLSSILISCPTTQQLSTWVAPNYPVTAVLFDKLQPKSDFLRNIFSRRNMKWVQQQLSLRWVRWWFCSDGDEDDKWYWDWVWE